MAKKSSLRAEVDSLRAELEALREDREAGETVVGMPDGDTEDTDFDIRSLLPDSADLEKAVDQFVQKTRKDLAEQPARAVAIAFLAGLVIGRLSKL